MDRRLKTILFIVFALGTGAGLISFASLENNDKVCTEVIVSIENQHENHFIDELDVLKLVNDNGALAVIGESYTRINMRMIETRVNNEPFIRNAQLFRDHKGNLLVNVEQRRPIARIIRADGPDAYIADDGVILPVSEKFTSRVMLVSGVGMKALSESQIVTDDENSQLFKLINYINNDEFLRAQIAQIHFQANNEIILYPQITKQTIEFGGYDNMELKFKKLMIFYRQILPRKGWNVYKKVNLKYKDQIICD